MHCRWLCALAVSAMSLTACSSSAVTPATSQQPVTVTIGIVYVGGPAPGYSGHLVPGTIQLKGLGIGASRQVAEGHTATFRVQPGDYLATARSGDAQCHATTVSAAAGMKSPVLLRCDVK